jgi:serine/threonine protein kinase
MIHRDLKPGNVFLVRDHKGRQKVKLGDFGISRVFESIAFTYKFAGTPKYMAPEIYMKREYNYSVDVWSIGVLLYEMLTNQIPFPARNIDEIEFKIRNHPP